MWTCPRMMEPKICIELRWSPKVGIKIQSKSLRTPCFYPFPPKNHRKAAILLRIFIITRAKSATNVMILRGEGVNAVYGAILVEFQYPLWGSKSTQCRFWAPSFADTSILIYRNLKLLTRDFVNPLLGKIITNDIFRFFRIFCQWGYFPKSLSRYNLSVCVYHILKYVVQKN